ncbi:HYD1 signature containing ADP-ribosyltransferase family protein [Flavobacterium sp. LBUM151]
MGRFFAVDPLAHEYSYNSPYAFSENRVIDMSELEGLETKGNGTSKQTTKRSSFHKRLSVDDIKRKLAEEAIKNDSDRRSNPEPQKQSPKGKSLSPMIILLNIFEEIQQYSERSYKEKQKKLRELKQEISDLKNESEKLKRELKELQDGKSKIDEKYAVPDYLLRDISDEHLPIRRIDQDGSSKKGPKMIRLRHYTSNQGLEGIRANMVIEAYDQNTVFAERAKGKPLSAADAADQYRIAKGSARNYIEFEVEDSRVSTKTNAQGATEYMIKGDVELDPKKTKFVKRN